MWVAYAALRHSCSSCLRLTIPVAAWGSHFDDRTLVSSSQWISVGIISSCFGAIILLIMVMVSATCDWSTTTNTTFWDCLLTTIVASYCNDDYDWTEHEIIN